jgi:TRAP-type C4-dicarboxylate transport system permease large subunit
MPFLLFFIVITFVFYLFYKVKYMRSRRPVLRQWLSAKSGIALGLFVCLFGINQLFIFQSTVTYIIATIFILLGGYNVYAGIKAYQFYLPQVLKETQNWSNQ